MIVQPAYIDDDGNLGDLVYGSATYIGHNIKSVTRVDDGVYDVVLADALVTAIGGDNPITFASRWAIVANVALFYEEDVAPFEGTSSPLRQAEFRSFSGHSAAGARLRRPLEGLGAS